MENIRFDFQYKDDQDETHGWNAIPFSNAQHAWVENIETYCKYFFKRY